MWHSLQWCGYIFITWSRSSRINTTLPFLNFLALRLRSLEVRFVEEGRPKPSAPDPEPHQGTRKTGQKGEKSPNLHAPLPDLGAVPGKTCGNDAIALRLRVSHTGWNLVILAHGQEREWGLTRMCTELQGTPIHISMSWDSSSSVIRGQGGRAASLATTGRLAYGRMRICVPSRVERDWI